jgi:hypothetical protein
MSLLERYRAARDEERVARLRRLVALRAMRATGMSQRQVADALGVSQPAVSQQLKVADLAGVHPQVLVAAAGPVLRQVVEDRGFTRLAVFGSVARGEARSDSDVDLLVDAPAGTSIGDLVALQELLADILGRPVDVVTYGGLKAGVDDDVRRDAVLL